MIHIAYVIYGEWRRQQSGLATFIATLLRLFEREGFDVDVIEIPEVELHEPAAVAQADALETATPGEGTPETRVAKPLRCLNARLTLGYLRMLLRDVRRLWPLRTRLRNRLILTNEFGCEVLPIALRCIKPWARIVAVGHTHPGIDRMGVLPSRRLVERLCYASVSDVVFNSHALKDEWRRKLGRKTIKGTVIWHGMEDQPRAVPSDYPPKPSADTVDFVCVARFVGWKGQLNLLNAWSLACTRTSVPMRLILVGDGPTLPECLHVARRLGLPIVDLANAVEPGESPSPVPRPPRTAVVFLGNRPSGADFFTPADVGVLPSVEPEAFGLVLLEMMIRGKPILASRLGGICEVVEDALTGVLVYPFDSEQVAASICRLAEDAGLRERLGQAGRARWEKYFRLDRMLDDYEAYFRGASGTERERLM